MSQLILEIKNLKSKLKFRREPVIKKNFQFLILDSLLYYIIKETLKMTKKKTNQNDVWLVAEIHMSI